MFPYWPRSVENRAALRTSIAALVAILIAFKFHLQSPYWSGMSVVVVANLYTGSIIDKAMMRIVGTIIGAFVGFYLAGIVANSFLLYLLSSFLIITVSVYYYNYSNYGYAYLLGALCAFIIISQITINPQNAFMVAIWRPVEIGIGVIVFAISVYAIFPNHLKDNILEQVHDLFNDVIADFKQLLTDLSQGTLDFTAAAQANLKFKKKIRKATELIGAMNRELGVTKERTDELRALLDLFINMARQINYLLTIPMQEKDSTIVQSLAIPAILTAMEHDFQQIQSAFIYSSPLSLELQTGPAIAQLEQQIQQRHEGKIPSDFINSFVLFLQQINRNISLMCALLSKTPIENEHKYKILNRQFRMRTDIELIKSAIKSGLAVLLALGFWLVSNWPGGINGIVSSLVLSIRKNMIEMKTAIYQRLIGCILGGGLALTSLAIVEMNLYDLIVILFLAVWAFTYFMFKYPKYAYIGLQANIALIITLAQEGGPPMLLDPPLQRLAGVVIGIVASFIVANVLWRTDVWATLNRYFNKIYQYVSFNLHQILLVENEQKTLHDISNIFWIARGLLESLGDSSLSLKKEKRLAQLRDKFESFVIIQATLSYILVVIDRVKARETAALFNYDLSTYEKKLVHFYEHKDKAAGEGLAHQLKKCAGDIELNSSSVTVEYHDLRNVLAYLNALNQLAVRIVY